MIHCRASLALLPSHLFLTLKGGSSGIAITGTIGGASANSDLTYDGGTVTLATVNTYNGPTTLIGGVTVNANITGALPTANGRSAIIMDDTGSGSSTLVLGTSAPQTVASLNGASSSAINLNANTLTFGTSSGGTAFAGVIAGSGGALVKDGASTQVLGGSNTYTGTTTVTAGNLVVNGNQSAASGAVLVSGTLAGSGTLGGAITIKSGGTLAPGAPDAPGAPSTPATLNKSSTLHFATGSIFEWSMNENQVGMAFDMVGGGGSSTVDTSNTVFKIVFGPAVNMDDTFWSAPSVTRQWAMASIFTSGFSGAFTSVDTGTYPVNSLGTFSINSSYLTYTTVPEPTTALAGLLLAAGLLRRHRSSTPA